MISGLGVVWYHGSFPRSRAEFKSLRPHPLMTPQQTEVDTPSKGPAESGENQEDQLNLPPFASRGEINVWFSSEDDKNGDTYLVIDAPFLETERVFIHDDMKSAMNEMKKSWKEQRNQAQKGAQK